MLQRALVVASVLVASSPARADRIADPPVAACKVARGAFSATFRPDTTVNDLVTWMMGISCKNIVIDSAVNRAATVTVLAPQKLTLAQAQRLFTDALEAIGVVVQAKKDTIVLKAGPTMARPCATASSSSPQAPGKTTGGDLTINPFERSGADSSSNLIDEATAQELDKGIRKLSDTSYEVSRALVDKFHANPMALLRGARVVPAVKDGKPDGFKLYAIRPSSLYARVGLLNGDTLQAVNGLEIKTPDHALEAYARASKADKVVLSLLRRGTPVTITIAIGK